MDPSPAPYLGARAARLARLGARAPVSSAPVLQAAGDPRLEAPSARRRDRAAWLLVLAAIPILVLAGLLWQSTQRAASLQVEVQALRGSEAHYASEQSELDTLLRLQQDKLTGQAAAMQSTDQDLAGLQQALQELRSRMARLDQHNAALREALGINDRGETPPASPVTPTATLTPGPNGFRPGGEGGESGPLLLLAGPGGGTGPALPPVDQLADLRAQIADMRHSLAAYEQIEDNLTGFAAAQVGQWAQMGEDDDSEAPAGIPGGEPPPSPAPAPGRAAQPPARRPTPVPAHVPSGYPYYGTISSLFGWRASPFVAGKVGYHKGVDIVAPLGTAVHATQAGRVAIAGWSDVYGRMVMIDHGAGWSTLYGHNSRLLVSVGDHVEKGEVIAYSGSTGMSTGPHIHYEVRYKDTPVNPARYR